MGAIQAADARLLLEPIVLSAIGDVTGRWFWRVEHFNDHRRTTHALVLRVLHRARERIVMGETAPKGAHLRIGPLLKPLTAWLARHACVVTSAR